MDPTPAGTPSDPAPDPAPDPSSGAERRSLIGSAFPDDDGAADPQLAALLAAWAAGAVDHPTALTALAGARLVVPVVAVLGESEVGPDGLERDKSADMAAVLIQRPDGRRALLAFTGVGPMAAWDPQARPVPVSAVDAARAARAEGADALVVDLAGPVQFAVEGRLLAALAGEVPAGD